MTEDELLSSLVNQFEEKKKFFNGFDPGQPDTKLRIGQELEMPDINIHRGFIILTR